MLSGQRRIALNVVATYGRSLYALVIGLFCGRWTLMALGEVDYGLFGLVGGLMAFVAFLNGIMAESVSRYYAFAVGKARVAADRDAGVEECRRWFSIALMLHTMVPVVLVAAGYPIGAYAIRELLVIPPERVDDCIVVWRCACAGGFVAMAGVPFSAMYNAKQEIAELTVYSFFTTTLNFLVLWYMVTHPGVWLAKYASYVCAISMLTQTTICWRAVVKYDECRFRREFVFDLQRMRSLLGFAGSRFLSAFSQLLSMQGLSVVVNKYLGPAKNAAMGIGNSIVSHAASLSSAMRGAFSPAITNVAGAGDMDAMRRMAMRSSRFSTVSVMLFAIPLLLEMREVVTLWLKTPPDGTVVLATFLLADLILGGISEGHCMSIFAMGRIARFLAWESIWFFLRFAMGWWLVSAGIGIAAIGVAYVVTGIGSVLVKVWFGRKLCGISARGWLAEVVIPLGIALAVSAAAGLLPRLAMEPSLIRVVATTATVEVVFLPLLWALVFSPDEKRIVAAKARQMLARLG